MNQQAKEERMRKQQMDEAIKREQNKNSKLNAQSATQNSKLNAAARQKQ